MFPALMAMIRGQSWPKKQNNYPVANSCMWNKQPIFHPWDASNESNDVL
jgi:hypothetical protein